MKKKNAKQIVNFLYTTYNILKRIKLWIIGNQSRQMSFCVGNEANNYGK